MSAVAAAENPRKPELVMLSPERREFYQHANQRHTITVEVGVTIEQVLRPEFLGHITSKLRMYDTVEVRADDGAYWAEILVLQVGPTWARTKLLRHERLHEQGNAVANPMSPYELAWKGPHLKWVMIRKADGSVIRDKMDKQEAESYMASYIKTTTGG